MQDGKVALDQWRNIQPYAQWTPARSLDRAVQVRGYGRLNAGMRVHVGITADLDEQLSRPAGGAHCAAGHTLHVFVKAHDLPDHAEGEVLRRRGFARAVSATVAVSCGARLICCIAVRGRITPGIVVLDGPVGINSCCAGRTVLLRILLGVCFGGGRPLLGCQSVRLLLRKILVPALRLRTLHKRGGQVYWSKS